MRKTIVITRSSEGAIQLAIQHSVESDYSVRNFNAHLFKRMLMDCVISLELEDGESAIEAVSDFYERYTIFPPGLSEDVFEDKDYYEAIDYINKNEQLATLFLSWLQDDSRVLVRPYHVLRLSDEHEMIIVDWLKVRQMLGENDRLSRNMRYGLVDAICEDCKVAKDGRNDLFIHDREWGEWFELKKIDYKELLVDGEGVLPPDVVEWKDYFSYVGVFIHRSNKVYNKFLNMIPKISKL